MKSIGLLGGTFDPVHFGHLRPALEIKECLDLSELRLLPCHVSPHREQPLATPQQRLQMLTLATSGSAALTVDARELNRPPPSYTVDTLEALKAEYPAACLVFVMGHDAFAGFKSWHRWERILELAHLAVTSRPGYRLQTLDFTVTQNSDELQRSSAGKVVHCEVTALGISASAIRAAVRGGRDIAYLVPRAVQDYILEQRIYLPD
ncbi:MAG: nicotinate-nucleotide adenylyltransferase [Gammaproteobacteria bacterium]|nr:nicotinate-nucleotide adenylyltransferase [Gammaproteobacteria bacterium]